MAATCLRAVPVSAAGAGFDAAGLVYAGTQQAATLDSAQDITMAETGTVRLACIDIPEDFEARARERVQALLDASNGALKLWHEKEAEPDRHDRLNVQARTEDGTWLQAELVRDGLARIFPCVEQDGIPPLLRLYEDTARANDAGLWGDWRYDVKTPERAAKFTNSFQVVEATVVDVAERRSALYVNFGEDWRTDFTVMIEKSDLRKLRRDGMEPLDWKDKTIRVRGWLEKYNGPLIRVRRMSQVEFPSPPSFAPPPRPAPRTDDDSDRLLQ